jgi:general stress protein 26
VIVATCSLKSYMDSINKQQPEENHKDLQDTEAIKKLKELCDKKSCFFCTNITTGQAFATRPMSVQKTDDDGSLWFLSANDSHKNAEITANPAVQLLFQGSSYSDFVTLYGHAAITEDKEKIKELWHPILKTWFTEGIDDPRISVIQVIPQTGYYWDTRHGKLVAFAKQVAGAITGKTLDDSIEGKLEISAANNKAAKASQVPNKTKVQSANTGAPNKNKTQNPKKEAPKASKVSTTKAPNKEMGHGSKKEEAKTNKATATKKAPGNRVASSK